MQLEKGDQPVRRIEFVVGDDIFDGEILIVVQRRFQASDSARGFRGVQNAFHLPGGKMQLLRHFLKRGVASQLAMELVPLYAGDQRRKRFPRMRRNADRFGLFVNSAANGLFDPVGAVGGVNEIPWSGSKFVDGVHEAEIAFLNNVEKVEAGPVILLTAMGITRRRLRSTSSFSPLCLPCWRVATVRVRTLRGKARENNFNGAGNIRIQHLNFFQPCSSINRF